MDLDRQKKATTTYLLFKLLGQSDGPRKARAGGPANGRLALSDPPPRGLQEPRLPVLGSSAFQHLCYFPDCAGSPRRLRPHLTRFAGVEDAERGPPSAPAQRGGPRLPRQDVIPARGDTPHCRRAPGSRTPRGRVSPFTRHVAAAARARGAPTTPGEEQRGRGRARRRPRPSPAAGPRTAPLPRHPHHPGPREMADAPQNGSRVGGGVQTASRRRPRPRVRIFRGGPGVGGMPTFLPTPSTRVSAPGRNSRGTPRPPLPPGQPCEAGRAGTSGELGRGSGPPKPRTRPPGAPSPNVPAVSAGWAGDRAERLPSPSLLPGSGCQAGGCGLWDLPGPLSPQRSSRPLPKLPFVSAFPETSQGNSAESPQARWLSLPRPPTPRCPQRMRLASGRGRGARPRRL